MGISGQRKYSKKTHVNGLYLSKNLNKVSSSLGVTLQGSDKSLKWPL